NGRELLKASRCKKGFCALFPCEQGSRNCRKQEPIEVKRNFFLKERMNPQPSFQHKESLSLHLGRNQF
ncbi:TPA: hypothetical protein ACGOR4_002065, partial [Streptococcus suis]